MSNENIIQSAANLGLGVEQTAANLLVGSQLGVGLRAVNLDAATPLVFSPAVIIVLQTPTMYKNEPAVGKMLKNLIETHAKSVTGIDFGYQLDTHGEPVGHDGQQIMVPTKAKRTTVNPSFTFPEVTGNLVWNLFRQWLVDIQDPDTNTSMSRFADQNITFMSSAYAMTMLAIQFDPTMNPKQIIDAALYTNMFPTDPGGVLGMERQIGQSKAMERTVTFTGHVQHNYATRALGVKIATELNLAKIKYGYAPVSLSTVDQGIAASGLSEEAKAALTYGPASI